MVAPWFHEPLWAPMGPPEAHGAWGHARVPLGTRGEGGRDGAGMAQEVPRTVFPGPWKEDQCFYIDLNTGEAFKVDDQTDNLTEAEINEHWDLVETADRRSRSLEKKRCGDVQREDT